MLHIGSVAPDMHDAGVYVRCTTAECASSPNVHAYLRGSSGTFDESTIFKVTRNSRNVYLANRASNVSIEQYPFLDAATAQTASFTFRNPVHFMDFVEATERDAAYEVEALIDHFFHHQNTASFLATRLIQRFVTSNPSPRYVLAVADAFRSGAYSGRVYSGEYGDFAATIMAILLDQEARSEALDADTTHGRLLEPLIKVLHVMRALEYRSKGREVELYQMEDTIGQASHNSPSVFSFFLPEYQPNGRLADAGLVAPEAQVGTAPLVVNFLNGMSSLIEYGLTQCFSGFGARYSGCNNAANAIDNSDGSLAYVPRSREPSEVVDELAMLLTRGQISSKTRAVVEAAYQSARISSGDGEALRVAQKLFIASADFHATAENNIVDTLRTVPPPQQSLGRRYKAIVVVFMHGAADTFNLLVPHSGCAPGSGTHASLDAEYEAVRTLAALPKSSLLPISDRAGGQPCSTFGVHPAFPFVKELYDQGEGAFVANIGGLVEPVTKAEFQAKSKPLPPSLFAHNIMQRAAWNVHAQYGAAKGVLGRIIDHMRSGSEPYASHLYSIFGTNKIVESVTVPGANFIDQTNGVARFNDLATLAGALANMTSQHSASAFADTHAGLLNSSLESTEQLGALLDSVQLSQTFETASISKQLKQVAKLIKLRSHNMTERDAFYVQLGGFDTHTNMLEKTHSNFEMINAALQSFVQEMRDQGSWEDVAIVTASDFGRTLTSNGLGTDHAWGGNHFVLSGSLNGSQIFGDYPSGLDSDAELNIGRGRIIPTTSWEGIWAPLARWFGVEESALPSILPNVNHFQNIIPKEKLFKATS